MCLEISGIAHKQGKKHWAYNFNTFWHVGNVKNGLVSEIKFSLELITLGL